MSSLYTVYNGTHLYYRYTDILTHGYITGWLSLYVNNTMDIILDLYQLNQFKVRNITV